MSEEHQSDKSKNEVAYRHGWQHSATETTLIILRLVEFGYNRRKINQLLAIYQDHFISEWRNNGNLEKKEPFPSFDIQRIEEIAASHRGYDWLLESE